MDSIGKRTAKDSMISIILEYLNSQVRAKLEDGRQFTFQNVNVNKQLNGYDCGMFVIFWARALMENGIEAVKEVKIDTSHRVQLIQDIHQAIIRDKKIPLLWPSRVETSGWQPSKPIMIATPDESVVDLIN
ncbi:uncharacterized protein A1O5_13469 [Cladophialophora psammophila CBS 110553]|uniref:Ubiquitin-like protease family profile domain-containing protein n=1 Tax=Cladophialophora psammophila CBS 110553 TaxID=1182543 RepID=W9VCT5_9EURO|nr:uncharacterized protein A1O5_13469 [Cladophialophora psammophila CBS 110553]EXJ53293.1 hypothetical protein A1O5_13469 [Cladophialophora psammophila CBS 110553]